MLTAILIQILIGSHRIYMTEHFPCKIQQVDHKADLCFTAYLLCPGIHLFVHRKDKRIWPLVFFNKVSHSKDTRLSVRNDKMMSSYSFIFSLTERLSILTCFFSSPIWIFRVSYNKRSLTLFMFVIRPVLVSYNPNILYPCCLLRQSPLRLSTDFTLCCDSLLSF